MITRASINAALNRRRDAAPTVRRVAGGDVAVAGPAGLAVYFADDLILPSAIYVCRGAGWPRRVETCTGWDAARVAAALLRHATEEP